MNTKSKFLVFLLLAVILAIQVAPASAQGKTPSSGPPDQLTPEQMKNAILVGTGDSNRPELQEGQVYRFANCNESNSEDACYFMIIGGENFDQNVSSTLMTPLATSATITCGRNLYNGAGKNVARLQQNVNVTFWGTYGQTPVTLNWGNLNGTFATVGYAWQDLAGPNPSPNWGVYVSRSGTAYSTAGGLFVFLGSVQSYISTRITIKSSGWSCS